MVEESSPDQTACKHLHAMLLAPAVPLVGTLLTSISTERFTYTGAKLKHRVLQDSMGITLNSPVYLK